MPIFEYECTACGRRVEEIQKFGDPPPVLEDACSGSGKVTLLVEIESQRVVQHVHRPGTEAVLIQKLGDDDIWLVEVRVADPLLEGEAWYELVELRADQFARHEVDPNARCILEKRPTTFTQRWNGDYSNDGRGGWVRQGQAMVRMTQGKNSTNYGEGSV